ncbi:unnamed protein product [Peniophora sp. CBMAI 1063]|nr:unnamed protein product [Peniophora sp. CBMAI 1063]
MSLAASPLHSDVTVPTLMENEPNALVEPPESEDFRCSLARLHSDLVWASRRTVTLRKQVVEADLQAIRSNRVSRTYRSPLWVVALLDEIRPAQDLVY